MANFVTNALTLTGPVERVQAALSYLKCDARVYEEYEEEEGKFEGELNSIDFNTIIPMPNWAYGSGPGLTNSDEAVIQKCGVENISLEWARRNWGTQRNALGQPDYRSVDNVIYFETTWSGVPDLIQKIAVLFPELTVAYRYADEQAGYETGSFIFKDTETLHSFTPKGGTKEAYELAFELDDCLREDYTFDEETNTYVSMYEAD